MTSEAECGQALGTYQSEPLYHANLDSAEYRSVAPMVVGPGARHGGPGARPCQRAQAVEPRTVSPPSDD
jgi:hypothetical protein